MRNSRHPMDGTQEHRAWRNMKARCYTPSATKYYCYGARGITVCDSWRYSFDNFYADMGPKPGPDYSLDRIDVDANYCKENCKWSTSKEQARNKRNTLRFTFCGTELALVEWAAMSGISLNVLSRRVVGLKWDFAKALSTPVNHPRGKR